MMWFKLLKNKPSKPVGEGQKRTFVKRLVQRFIEEIPEGHMFSAHSVLKFYHSERQSRYKFEDWEPKVKHIVQHLNKWWPSVQNKKIRVGHKNIDYYGKFDLSLELSNPGQTIYVKGEWDEHEGIAPKIQDTTKEEYENMSKEKKMKYHGAMVYVYRKEKNNELYYFHKNMYNRLKKGKLKRPTFFTLEDKIKDENVMKDEEYDEHLRELAQAPTTPIEKEIAYENFDFGDVDNKSWKTIGEEPENHKENMSVKIQYVKKALLSYDFIERFDVSELFSDKALLSIQQSSKDTFKIQIERQLLRIRDVKNFEFSLTAEIQHVVNTILHHYLTPVPEMRARELVEGLIKDPTIDATLEGNMIKVIGKPSNREYRIPLASLEIIGGHCPVMTSLPWYKRPREKAIQNKNSQKYGKTFEDLPNNDANIRLCIGSNWDIPDGDIITSIILSLQNEEKSRKDINVLDAFLKVDEVPDHWSVYVYTHPEEAIDINAESAGDFLTGSRSHPFDFWGISGEQQLEEE